MDILDVGELQDRRQYRDDGPFGLGDQLPGIRVNAVQMRRTNQYSNCQERKRFREADPRRAHAD
jgi:hypothetical protein